MTDPKPDIPYDRKVDPAPFLRSGWESANGRHLYWPQDDAGQPQSASLELRLPSTGKVFFMAEVSAYSRDASTLPSRTVAIRANGTPIGEWHLDASTVHDKLLVIPAERTGEGLRLTFDFPPDSEADIALQLHTISISDRLDSYLEELQTGYDWVCAERRKLLDSANYVLHLLESGNVSDSTLIAQLMSIAESEKRFINKDERFDIAYVDKQFDLLKEGKVHNEIRKWHSTIHAIQQITNKIGSTLATSPDNQVYSRIEFERLADTMHVDYTDSIQTLREQNSLLNNLEILLEKSDIESIPPVLYLDMTNVCNFRCRMCYQSKLDFMQTHLSNDHLLTITRLLPFFQAITIAGLGEPLLGKNLSRFAQEAAHLRCELTIITNGSLIHNHLHTLKHFSKVSISFDGATAQTFETLRHGANFRKIIDNLRLLRQFAPATRIAFSVVVSRANVDEVAGIVAIAASLGVNEIDLTPMEHIPWLMLKLSDHPTWQEQLAEATSVAATHGIRLNNNLTDETFSANDDTPRCKASLLRSIPSLATRHDERVSLAQLSARLASQHFRYHPDAAIFLSPPPTPAPVTKAPKATQPDRELSPLDIDAELQRIRARVSVLREELSRTPSAVRPLPYCLDPWKLAYVKSNGQLRLCCHSDATTGTIPGDDEVPHFLSSHTYQNIRASMFRPETMPADCKRCRATDRFLGLDDLRATCNRLNIRLKS